MLNQVHARSVYFAQSSLTPRIRIITSSLRSSATPSWLKQIRYSSNQNNNPKKGNEDEEEIDLITLQKKPHKDKQKNKKKIQTAFGDRLLEQHEQYIESNTGSETPFEHSSRVSLRHEKKHGIKTMNRSSGVKSNHLKNLILKNSGSPSVKTGIVKKVDLKHSDSLATNVLESLSKSENNSKSDATPSKVAELPNNEVIFDEPMGYAYFNGVFKNQQELLKNFLSGKDLETQEIPKLLELFKKLMKFNKQVKNKDNMLLFLTTLSRNEQYLNYFIWLNFGIDKRQNKTGKFEIVEEETEEELIQKGAKSEIRIEIKKEQSPLEKLNEAKSDIESNSKVEIESNKAQPSLVEQDSRKELIEEEVKPDFKIRIQKEQPTVMEKEVNTPENMTNTIGELRSTIKTQPVESRKHGSFKDLLSSINKVSKNTSSDNGLPKMTKLSPMPIFEQYDYSKNLEDISAASEVNAESMESFLNDAKKKDDLNQDMLFKAKLNYEWSKQQMSGNPKTLENGNFFTPVLIPKTVVPINSLVHSSDSAIDSKYNKTTGNVNCLLLYRDGSISKKSKLQLPIQQKNIFNILQKVQRPELFTNNINKLLNRGYKLVDGDYTKLIFVRDTPVVLWKLFKNIMALIGCGFLTLLGLSYFMDIPQQELKPLNSEGLEPNPTSEVNK